MVAVFMKFMAALFLVTLALFFASGLVPRAKAQQDGPDCAELVRDVTVPKGSIAYPGERFEKVWLVRNCGESEWIGYQAIRVVGEGQNSFSILPTAPKTEMEVSVEIQAPNRPGNYAFVYEIARPYDDMRRIVRFGEQLRVEFIVAQFVEVYLGNETEVEIKIEVEEN